MANGNLNLGNILSQVETIKGQRQQNALLGQQFDARDLAGTRENEQNVLLQRFLAGDQSAFNALAPDVQQQIRAGQLQEQQLATGERKANQEEAGILVRGADSILASASPKKLMLTAFPDFVERLVEAEFDIDELTDDDVRELATNIKAEFGPIAGIDLVAERSERAEKSQKLADEQAEILAKSSKAQAETKQKQFDNIDKLVTRAKADKRVDNFIQVQTFMDRIRAAAEDVTGASDVSMIFAFMKMLDPGSVVRESEFQLASDTAGAPEFVRAAASRLISGERLTDVSRANFIKEAEKIFNRSKATADKAIKPIITRAKRFGLRGETIQESIFGLAPTVVKSKNFVFDASGNLVEQQ